MPENHYSPENADPEFDQPDDAEMADAYAALDEDRRQQAALGARSAGMASSSLDQAAAEPTGTQSVETLPTVPAAPVAAQPTGEPLASNAPSQPQRRVFLIDGKEYPDPDPKLPIAGTRSVQAMYRDYFPGQLDNADAVGKTRDDGTLEVTFKRRIGTKGAFSPRRPRE